MLLRHFARSLPQRQLGRRTLSTMVQAQSHTITHWDSKTCPYAQRSWIALEEKQLRYEIKVVDLQNKSEAFKEEYASIHPDPQAPAKVPILVDGDVKLIESNIIVEYLAAKYAVQGQQLLPADPVQAAKARLFVELFAQQVTTPMFGLLRADSQQSLAEAKEKYAQGLQHLDVFLQRHGTTAGGDYLLGEQYSLAEVGTTSFVQRALAALPHYRGVDTWALLKEQGLTRLEAWMKAALARPSAKATKPADEVIISSWQKFVVPMKD